MAMSALALAACETTQPDRVTARDVSISFAATGNLKRLSCYELWLDTSNPLDGIGDVFLEEIDCFEPIPNSEEDRTDELPLPWHYSVIITVIRAGTTAEQLLFSNDGVPGTTSLPDDGLDTFFSLTDYDHSQLSAAIRPPNGEFVYQNGVRVSWGSPIYIGGVSASCPTCPQTLGPPTIAGGPPSFDFTLNAGDTVVVRARKQLFAAAPGYIPVKPAGTAENVQVALVASLTVGGVPVQPNGTTTSSDADGSDLSFSYTVQ